MMAAIIGVTGFAIPVSFKKFTMSVPWTLFYSNVVFWNDLTGTCISQEVYKAAVWDGSDTMQPMEDLSLPDG